MLHHVEELDCSQNEPLYLEFVEPDLGVYTLTNSSPKLVTKTAKSTDLSSCSTNGIVCSSNEPGRSTNDSSSFVERTQSFDEQQFIVRRTNSAVRRTMGDFYSKMPTICCCAFYGAVYWTFSPFSTC